MMPRGLQRLALAVALVVAIAIMALDLEGDGGQHWAVADPLRHRTTSAAIASMRGTISLPGPLYIHLTGIMAPNHAVQPSVLPAVAVAQQQPWQGRRWLWLMSAVGFLAMVWRRRATSNGPGRPFCLVAMSGVPDPPALTLALTRGLLSDGEAHEFLRDGHLCVPQLLDAGFVTQRLAPAIHEWLGANQLAPLRHAVQTTLGTDNTAELTLEECHKKLAGGNPEAVPFLQSFNLWQTCPAAQQLALSPALGRIAAQLLDVPAVRLYQDSVFVKRPGDGPTEWHSDLNMAPFDTNDFITCWVPLQPVPSAYEGGTGLSFATASHRDFALPFWSDPRAMDLSGRYDVVEGEALEVGDCTFHHGWVLHCAPGNPLDKARVAYCVSYVADGARLLGKEGHVRVPDGEDYPSYQAWVEEVGWGEVAEHPLLPLVFLEDKDTDCDAA